MSRWSWRGRDAIPRLLLYDAARVRERERRRRFGPRGRKMCVARGFYFNIITRSLSSPETAILLLTQRGHARPPPPPTDLHWIARKWPDAVITSFIVVPSRGRAYINTFKKSESNDRPRAYLGTSTRVYYTHTHTNARETFSFLILLRL